MRVTIIHWRVVLKGGLETRLYNYINYFLERGHEVTLVTGKIDPNIQLPGKLIIKKINLKKVPKPIRTLVFNSRLKKVLKSIPSDFTLSLGRTSHQDYLIAPNTHVGYLKALERRGIYPNDWIELLLDRLSYKRAKVIYACSQMVKDEIIKYYKVKENKIKVLYPPVNTTKFNQSKRNQRKELRQKFGIPEDAKVFLLVSTGHSRKGLPLLEKIFIQLNKNFLLVVAGTPFEPISPNIRSLGFVQEVDELYSLSDFTLHPAIYEPFGQIVLESLQCGTPVIVSNKVGAKEVLSELTGLIIGSFDPEVWIKAIKSAVETEFKIEPDFAQQHGLTLEAHMEKMLSFRQNNT